MGKRVLAVCMAVVVAFGCSLYRPQKAYANAITLTGEGLEVLFGLLGATGVVVGIDKTMEQRFVDAQELFDSLPADQQQSYIDWLATGEFVTSDTGHEVFYPDMTLDTSWYSDFWQSVTGYTSTFVSYSPAIDGLENYNLPADGSGDFYTDYVSLGSCFDSPFFVRTLNGSSEVQCLLSDGHFLQYVVNSSTGAVKVVSFIDCPLNTQLQLKLKYKSSNGYDGAYCTVYAVGVMGSTMGVTLTNDVGNPSGIAWGSADSGFVYGLLASGSMLFYNGIASTAELIPCDTWVSKWDDAKAENRQVGIITGQDLSNYNGLSDIYNPETGLVTGLDVPVVDVPDVPADDILSRLKALPSDIVNALRDLLASLFIPTTTVLDDFVFETRGKLPVIDNFFSIDLNNYVADDGKPRWFFVYKGVEYDIFDMSIFDRYRTMLHMIIIAIAYYRFYRWVLKIMPSVIKGR